MSCEAIQKIIEKRKTRKITPMERGVVMHHCFSCRACRKLNQRALNKLIEKESEGGSEE